MIYISISILKNTLETYFFKETLCENSYQYNGMENTDAY